MRPALRERRELDQREHLADARGDFTARPRFLLEAEGDVSFDGQMRK